MWKRRFFGEKLHVLIYYLFYKKEVFRVFDNFMHKSSDSDRRRRSARNALVYRTFSSGDERTKAKNVLYYHFSFANADARLSYTYRKERHEENLQNLHIVSE